MAQQTIKTGTVANDGTGDTLRASFIKTNNNFTELYFHHANNYANVFNLQNSVVSLSQTSNSTISLAQAAFNRANLSNDVVFVTASYDTANAGFGKANDAYDLANAAYVYANTIIGESTNLIPVFTVTNAAFNFANSVSTNTAAAFTRANSVFDYANGVSTNTSAAFTKANDAIDLINISANASFEFTNDVSTITTAAFAKANSAYDLANGAYVYANTLVSESTNLTPVFTVANAAFDAANSVNSIPAFDKANIAYDLANGAYVYANTLISENTDLSGVYAVANASFDLANGVSTNTTAAFGFANTINTFAYGAATNAEAAFSHANTALQNTTGTFAGSLTVTGNTIVDGIAPGYAPNRPAFRVHGSGVTNDLSTTVNGTGCLTANNWTVDFNQGTYLSNTNGVFIAPVTGLYQVNIVARNSDYLSGISQLGVTKNGSSGGTVGGDCIMMVEFGANSSMNHAGAGTVINLMAGDTLACKILAGEINFDSNDNWSVAYIG